MKPSPFTFDTATGRASRPFRSSQVRIFALVLAVMLLVGCAPAAATPTSAPAAAPTAAAPAGGAFEQLVPASQAFVDLLNKGDFAAAFSRFDGTMKTAMPEAKLKETWQQLLGQVGAFQKQLGTRTTETTQQGQLYRIVFVTCQFEKAVIDVRLVYNAQGQVSGLFFSQGQAPGPTPTASSGLIPAAEALVDGLARGDYGAASSRFDSQMKAAAPETVLQFFWQRLIFNLGPFQGRGTARASQVQGYEAVYVTCRFEKGPYDVLVIFNSGAQVVGLQYSTPQDASGRPLAFATPPYVKTGAFRESEVTVGSGDWALPGTLAMPEGSGPFPAVVLVHGSGPNDRDETIGPNKPFRDLAWGLASQGVAVLRYDKRTFVHGARLTAQFGENLTVKEEVTEDALLAAQLLRQTPGVDPRRVFLLGHSLGATLAPRIAQQDPGLAGLIVLAGLSTPLEDAVLDQYTYLFSQNGPITAEQQAQLDQIATQAARVKEPALTVKTPAASLPLGIPAAYWLDLRGYRPAEVAASLAMPLLVLQGGRDYQVTPAKDFEGWKSTLSNKSTATLKLYPALNHLFIAGIGPANPGEYQIAAHVSEEVINDIARWIKQ